jgi:signal transduction histidine kinase
LSDEIMEIPDALLDARFAHNPLVRGYPHIRFYAGVPLIVSSGDTLGTLCVIDHQPRTLTAEQRAGLRAIAAMVIAQFEKRRAFARLFDGVPAELYEVDAATGRIAFVSDAAASNSGYSPSELRALVLPDILPELFVVDDFAAFVQALRRAPGRREPTRSRLRRKDGSSYLVDVRFEPSADMLLALCWARESPSSTNGADGPTALELRNDRLTVLTAVARNLFDALDPRGLVNALVQGAAAVTGGGSAQLVARGANGEFFLTRNLAVRAEAPLGPDALLQAAAAQSEVALDAHGTRAAVRILAPSGALAYVLEIRSPGRPFGPPDAFAFALLGDYLAVAVRNVELYAELQSRRAAVIELNQVKNDLIAMLAHDFKGPLTTIVGLADVLAEDERFDAESHRLLAMINSSAMRLASLATDTLALSRLDHNELSLRIEPVDIVALVRDIVRVLGVTRGIDMRASVPESIVQADPARLRQVFENLIGNAIKYSPRGDTVDVTVREKRDGVEIAIRDSGIGISPADLSKLFRRFARGSNARGLGIGGTGFGLYLARTIVERHGGTIAVESKEGSGSTFRVLVPTVPAPQRTRDRRILLLDNEGDGRSFIAHTLRDEGYAVYSVADETELFAALDERRYDAAIVDCDILATPMNELAERIGGRTTLLRLVSIAEPEGGLDHPTLRKPFLIKDLQALVEAAVADRRRGPRRSGPERST